MQSLVEWGLANAATAAVLAVCVALVTRVWRNPHLAHLLWLVVLFRLVAPPVIQIPVHLPDWRGPQIVPARAGDSLPVAIAEPSRVSRTDATESRPPATRFAPSAGPSAPSLPSTLPTEPPVPAVAQSASFTSAQPVSKPIPIWNVLAGIWTSGSLLYVAVTVARVHRFGRAVRRSPATVPAWLEHELQEIAQAIGLRRIPRVSVVEWALPPMIWSGTRPTLLIPQALVASIDPVQRSLLLLHELLHIRRRDHLTRWFAIAVLALYWWNPFAWWAVRKLQNAEEECCDAAVLTFDPKQSETYGEALLAVSEFVSCGSLPTPAVSVGVERKNHLKRRMTMILEGSHWPKLTKARMAAVIAFGGMILGISLTAASAQVASSEAKGTTPSPAQSPAQSETVKLGSSQTSSTRASAAEHRLAGVPSYECIPIFDHPRDNDRIKLLKQRYVAACDALRIYHNQQVVAGTLPPLGELLAAGKHARDAELALFENSPRSLDTLERYLAFTKDLEQVAEQRLAIAGNTGRNRLEVSEMRQARLVAEIELHDRQQAHRTLQISSGHGTADLRSPDERTRVTLQSLLIRVRIAQAEVTAARALAQQNEAELKRALANLKYRETTLARIEQLRKHSTVSQGDVDEATHLRDDAAANVEAARAAIAGAEAQGAIKVAQLEQVQLELKQAKEAGK